MNSNTKFIRQITKINLQIQKKIWVFQNIGIFSVFFLFLGFIFGNLFGTFLESFRGFFNWDGFIIIFTICLGEFISYLNYSKKKVKTEPRYKFPSFLSYPFKIFLFAPKSQSKGSKFQAAAKNKPQASFVRQSLNEKSKIFQKSTPLKILNFYKIGLFLGFFIDAFKVGS